MGLSVLGSLKTPSASEASSETEDKRDPRADESIAMHAKPGTLGRGVGIFAVIALVGLSVRRKFFPRGYYARASPKEKRDSGEPSAEPEKPEINTKSMSPREIRARAAEARAAMLKASESQ
eukprot:CAMPEP_0118932466 /NCGR_PEP_ID=MMETSP1169-20130426/10291_1 /TAXON_ID=36882 /ORGANISM="Pyramimonas obovata, Strain CCMP722" /LENGTH=120 /DNA_ID=CAMNT_0006875129 /DNA_START=135 /DNA_END=497 /DNA_ORIENTATION=+